MSRLGRQPDAAPRPQRLGRPPLIRAGRRGSIGDAEEFAGAMLVESAHQAVIGADHNRE
jgi:hypothetical protein